MKWPLVLSWFALQHSCIKAASSLECEFPSHWSGSWFESGVQGKVVVNGTNISTKGRCMQAEGEKFLIRAPDCLRCISMHERHPNVLQYKETWCDTKGSTTLKEVCDNLDGDAVLHSLFRSGAAPSPCPIRGPLEFTYSIGSDGKECTSTSSFAEACTQDSRLLLRYQACPDVPATESADVELECLATWKEGSTQYLVARLYFRKMERRLANDEERYRCFVYTKNFNNTWYLAQSGDATCSALDSATAGDRSLKMIQKPVSEQCSYPMWLLAAKSWIALDTMASTLLTSTYNITILDRNETHLACHKILDDQHQPNGGSRRGNQVMLVAKATRGCDNGYVCLVFHKRDDPVIEMQLSKTWTQSPEEACNASKFNYLTAPYKTYITVDLTTRQCPYLGHYEVVYVMRAHEYAEKSFVSDDEEPRLSQDEDNGAHVQEVRITSTTPFPRPCQHTSIPGLDIGCERPDRMKFATSCSDEALSEWLCEVGAPFKCPLRRILGDYSPERGHFTRVHCICLGRKKVLYECEFINRTEGEDYNHMKYLCHGTWVENDTAYLVASTDSGRYCLVYSALAATSGSRELSVTGHLASCPRPSHRYQQHAWKVNLTSYTQCGDVSSSSPWTSGGSTGKLSLVIMNLFVRYVTR